MGSKTFLSLLLFLTLLLFPASPVQAAIIVDHSAVDQFDTIPDNIITNAAAIKLILRHASVGSNINNGLNSLFSSNSKYNRNNWFFQPRGNPSWQEKIDDLTTTVSQNLASIDTFSMKFCYIDVNADFSTYKDAMIDLMALYSAKKFVWWTMPIQTTGNANRDTFNNQVRMFAEANPNIILFDIADIESHDPSGNPIKNNGHEAMYSSYSSDGGHLNSAGSLRVAKAFWYLMSRISGWNESSPSPSPSSSPTVYPGLSWWPAAVNPNVGEQINYQFSLPQSGNYIIKAMVNAPTDGDNSFLLDIDQVPQEPAQVWDIINLTSGIEERTVSLRGNGTFDQDEFTPKVFTLNQGIHTLHLIGREPGTQLNQLKLEPYAAKPGDADGDGVVDGIDYVVWLNHYGQTVSGSNIVGDFNNSGKVDGVDYVIWLNNYGT